LKKKSILHKNYISQNALELTCSNVEFQNFPGVTPLDPRFKSREEGRKGEREEGKRKGKGKGKVGERKVGEENGDRPPTIFGLKVALPVVAEE